VEWIKTYDLAEARDNVNQLLTATLKSRLQPEPRDLRLSGVVARNPPSAYTLATRISMTSQHPGGRRL
jgi:hypothetical protein